MQHTEQFDKKIKTFGHIVLWVYLSALIYTTLFTYNYYVYGQSFNLVPLDNIKLMWRSGDYWLIFKNVIGNVLLFFPLGFLLPLVMKWMRSIIRTTFFGFFVSITIEILQYEFAERIFDIDDILLNGLGSVIGYTVFKIGNIIYQIIRRNI